LSTTTPTPKALILVAAEVEAELLFGPAERRAAWLDICVAGVGTSGDAAASEAICSTSSALVLNPGFAGGLSSAAVPGRLFTVTKWAGAKPPDEHADVPPALLDALAGLSVQPAIGATVQRPVSDPAPRRRLASAGADLVEMEGARWAAVASQRSLPFVSLRVISDRADNALPRPRHELLTANGSVRWARWLRAVAASDCGWLESRARLRCAQRDWRSACATLRTVGAALTAWQETAGERQ